MRSFVSALAALLICSIPIARAESQLPECEKKLLIELSQTHYTLNIWEHVKDASNTVTFQLPVTCNFYEQVKVGDDLLQKKFRWGSLVKNGSFGTWNLKIVGK